MRCSWPLLSNSKSCPHNLKSHISQTHLPSLIPSFSSTLQHSNSQPLYLSTHPTHPPYHPATSNHHPTPPAQPSHPHTPSDSTPQSGIMHTHPPVYARQNDAAERYARPEIRRAEDGSRAPEELRAEGGHGRFCGDGGWGVGGGYSVFVSSGAGDWSCFARVWFWGEGN